MLKGYNNDFFIKKDITDEGVIFFLQRWLEIFEPRTLDSYQYTLMNIVVGMKEYLEVIEKTLDGDFLTIDNVDACRNELFRMFKEDDIIAYQNRGLYNRIKYHLSNGMKRDEKAKLLRAKAEISYALKLVEPEYQKWIMDELLNDIKNGNFSNIQSRLKTLASICISKGWTPYGASSLVNRLFIVDEKLDLDSIWEEFSSQLNKNHAFNVYINLKLNSKGKGTKDSELTELIETLNISILEYENIINENKAIEKNKLPVNKEKKYMRFSVEAKDVKAAALKAVNTLNNKITILAFYNKMSAWSLKDLDGFVIMNETSYIWQFKIENLYKTYLFLDSSNKVFENAMKVYSTSDEKSRLTYNALKGVFNYTNISLLSVYPEEKFMNLWIALESFMRTGQYSNIISHIKEVLPPIVCKRYIYRLIRNFAEDCRRCQVTLDLTRGVINLDDDSKQNLVIELIRCIRDDDLFKEMKTICSENILLCYRLDELRGILLSNEGVLNKITRYYETISWQIQRLYRIRNEIAHSAMEDNNYLVTYIEHLHDYLGILITEIVFVSSEMEIKSIEEIFPYLKDNYDAFVNLVNDKKNSLSSDTLTDGIINYL